MAVILTMLTVGIIVLIGGMGFLFAKGDNPQKKKRYDQTLL